MKCRYMRLFVLFDLPTTSKIDMAEYRNFRKFLIKNGFIMMQESVYCRLVLHGASAQLVKKQLYKHLPQSGHVQLLQITERQFAEIEYLKGKPKTNVITSNQRIIEL